MHEEIELTREVEAIQIPSGDLVHLPQGTKVMITQALGGTYTVATQSGLARIKSENADALGIDLEVEKEKKSVTAQKVADGDFQGAVWDQLKLVFDPEIPVNIVDLGLVYDCSIREEEGQQNVEIKMTLTAPGCGMGPTIAADAQSKILMLEGIDNAQVDLVWDPVWNQDMISEEGKMKLGMI
ncbi:MAG: putative Fe-S cluster assembly protein SufT [Verrucomicrobiales bacterium]|jgi:probable FeS assembly SUF system protein SufT|nr:putative Fe-S cluster assembly protein SufT [Verrucomicrobiales bacterium]MDA9924617.1 putative Fe-S cluster assembly protein SufT [Verrucomicrobiales bacterium]MDC0252098.1 putative Fe-S cluster assembly protein SufT [bacterium]